MRSTALLALILAASCTAPPSSKTPTPPAAPPPAAPEFVAELPRTLVPPDGKRRGAKIHGAYFVRANILLVLWSDHLENGGGGTYADFFRREGGKFTASSRTALLEQSVLYAATRQERNGDVVFLASESGPDSLNLWQVSAADLSVDHKRFDAHPMDLSMARARDGTLWMSHDLHEMTGRHSSRAMIGISRFEERQWTRSVDVRDAECALEDASIAIDAARAIHMLYVKNRPDKPDQLVYRVHARGELGPERLLENMFCHAMTLIERPDGSIWGFWRSGHSTHYANLSVPDGPVNAFEPDGGDRVHVLQDGETLYATSSNGPVIVRRFRDGRWRAPCAVAREGQTAKVARDTDGTLVVAWAEGNGLRTTRLLRPDEIRRPSTDVAMLIRETSSEDEHDQVYGMRGLMARGLPVKPHVEAAARAASGPAAQRLLHVVAAIDLRTRIDAQFAATLDEDALLKATSPSAEERAACMSSLCRREDPRVEPIFRHFVDDPDASVRHGAVVWAGGQRSGRFAADVRRKLDDPDADVRNAAMAAALELADRQAVPALERLFRTDPVERNRTWAALTLGRMDAVSAAPTLMAAYDGASDDLRTTIVGEVASFRHPAHLEFVRAALGDRYFITRGAAARALGQLGDTASCERIEKLYEDQLTADYAAYPHGLLGYAKAFAKIEPFLKSGDYGNAALEALVAIDPRRAAPHVRKRLASRDRFVRIRAVGVAAKIGDPDVAKTLLALLRGENDADERMEIARALGEMKATEAREDLLKLAKSELLLDQIGALEGLVLLGEPVEAAGVERLADEGQFRLALVLEKLATPWAVDQLLALLRDARAHRRYEAAEALGRLKEKRALPHLVELLDDPHSGLDQGTRAYRRVYDAAVDAIESITGQRFADADPRRRAAKCREWCRRGK